MRPLAENSLKAGGVRYYQLIDYFYFAGRHSGIFASARGHAAGWPGDHTWSGFELPGSAAGCGCEYVFRERIFCVALRFALSAAKAGRSADT
jgi:hypothetical protein